MPPIAVLLAILSILSTFDGLSVDACCTFNNPSTCAFTSTTWKWTNPGDYPITTTYPGFLNLPDYMWLQDDSGTLDLNGFTINDMNTLVNFNYFYDTPTPGLGSYFHVFFIPTVGTTSPVLLYETVLPVDQWLNVSIPCNAEHSYCCGSRYSFPCFGDIQVIASLSAFPATGLFGFDDLCIIQSEPLCCDFVSSTACGFINDPSNPFGYDWRWNVDLTPPYAIPPPSTGSYYYFQLNTATIPGPLDSTFISDIFTIPGSYDFDIEYYVEMATGIDIGSGLRVYFVEATNNIRTELAFFQLPLAKWTSTVVSCSTPTNACCLGKASCAGRLEFVGHAEPSEGIVTTAVSYIGTYGYCP
ncbi:hypothetical protein CHUAL_004179 [Chamberlinius hualienensis]